MWSSFYSPTPQRGCPGEGLLGPQGGALHSTSADPLLRCLHSTTCNLGGAAAVHTKIEDAMKAFIGQNYPTLGDPATLTVVPDLPEPETGMTMADMVRTMYSSMGSKGGLLEGHPDIPTILADPNLDPAKKKILQEMQKKYGGEKGEAEVMVAVMDAMAGQEGLVMLGHKTALSLVEDTFRKELEKAAVPEEDRQMEVLEKLFSYIGVTPDRSKMQGEAEKEVLQYFGSLGVQTGAAVESTIARQRVNVDGNKHDKARMRHTMNTLQKAVDDNNAKAIPDTFLNPTQILLLAKMKTELNKMKREHDITIVRPSEKTVTQIEVKAVEKEKNRRNKIVQSALKQLEGGKEELQRLHGHLLDATWSYVGLIALTNLTSKERDEMCREKNFCRNCKQFILVDVPKELADLSTQLTMANSPCQEEQVWRPQSRLLMGRLVSLESLVPSLRTMERITGAKEGVTGAFTEKDRLNLDLLNCSVADLVRWQEAGHLGNPLRALFLNNLQLPLWAIRLLVFLSDYSVGKTTMEKARAVSLALKGDTVAFFFLGEGKPKELEPMMGVVNKLQLATISPNITALSLTDLRAMAGAGDKSGLELVTHYVRTSTNPPDHIFLDEAPLQVKGRKVDIPATVASLTSLASLLSPTSFLWTAFHTAQVRDSTPGTKMAQVRDVTDGGASMAAAEVSQLRAALTAATFTLPDMRQNMRNSKAQWGSQTLAGGNLISKS